MFAIMPSILFDMTNAVAKVDVVSTSNESEVIRDNWLEKKLQNINKSYEDAVKKINESSFSDENKKILLEQAEENRNLAVECAKKKNILRDRYRKERQNLILQMK